ncbi:hypothetical protein GCM10022206_44930 [Streptomyces chiangmaiensis]
MIPAGHESRRLAAGPVVRIRSAFYPTAPVALAYNLRPAMSTGIVPDGIDALTCTNRTRTSPSTALLSHLKGRTGRESLNINGPAVRLLDQWFKHSAPLREHTADTADEDITARGVGIVRHRRGVGPQGQKSEALSGSARQGESCRHTEANQCMSGRFWYQARAATSRAKAATMTTTRT